MAGVASALGDPLIAASVPIVRGRLALLECDPAGALHYFEHAEQLTRGGELAAPEINALTGIGEAFLALRKPRLALAATRRATELHRAHDLATLDAMSPTLLWWTHSRALYANKNTKAAREALGDRVSDHAQGHRQPERRRTAPQLLEQGRGRTARSFTPGSRMRASATWRRSGAPPTCKAKPICASRSNAWSTRDCA